MSRAYTCDNLISTFPYVLSTDKKQEALANATAEELSSLYEQNRYAEVYNRIDELDEELCDILAYDYKIDWYMWTATVEAKRALIKSHFEVHRHLGTKGAVTTALSAVCPGTYVEEWFEYGGKPYYYRVIIDVTEQKTAIRQTEIERMLRIFKSVRSVLEPNRITLRSRDTVIVSCIGNFAFFRARICGTYPKNAVHGRIYDNVVLVESLGITTKYPIPQSGDVVTGTIPEVAEQGRQYSDTITVTPEGIATNYVIAEANDYAAGTVPQAVKKGGLTENYIDITSEFTEADFAVSVAGTTPETATTGDITDNVVSAAADSVTHSYDIPANGTTPAAAQQGSPQGNGIQLQSTGESAAFNAHYCGTPLGTL